MMWMLLLIFLACFQMSFYFVTTAWIFEIGLCENSINQSNLLAQDSILYNYCPTIETSQKITSLLIKLPVPWITFLDPTHILPAPR